MSYNLKEESTKLYVLKLKKDGLSSYKISEKTNLNARSIQKFLAKDTFTDWWVNRDKQMSETPNACKPVGQAIQPMPLSPLATTGKQPDLEFIKQLKDSFKVGPNPSELKAKSRWEMYDDMGLFSGEYNKKPLKIIVIADTQAKPNVSLDYMKWIGRYIFDKKPDVIVHIGDAYDFESLSSYDRGKKSFEGRRLKADIEAGNKSMEYLISEFDKDGYKPRMVFCMGNHEDRFDRLSRDMPELDGFVGTETLNLESMGWEVYPFLKPAVIENIYFVHYLANPFTGKPYAGTALNQLKTVGNSFVVGHKQCLDVAIRPTLDGRHQIGIINGAAYDFEEAYKGYTGNNHFRGITVLHEVEDGFALPMFVSLNYLKKRYG